MGRGDSPTPPTSPLVEAAAAATPPASPTSPPSFQIERPVPETYFVLEIFYSNSFKQSNAAKEITYRARLKNSSN